ncbi:hypothetical protein [Rheinheimera faecalis]|uniref:hypothetical protein n=1 Tax=Rheinheimera faecalis TaxID=2901141 RepID=UPI001E32798C|nr:hypothetical protein [Rheinheimera faecalis]
MAKCLHLPFESLLGIHPLLKSTIAKLHGLMYCASINDITPEGLHRLINLYPICVVKSREKSVDGYFVIAGLRQYELLCAYHASTDYQEVAAISPLHTLQVREFSKLKDSEIFAMAMDDLTGSALLFSFGSKVAAQMDILKSAVGPYFVSDYPIYKSPRNIAKKKAKDE